MPKKTVDNSVLERWRGMEAATALRFLANHAVQDRAFKPTTSTSTTRWHASAGGHEFELVCTGPRFFDTRAKRGGGGAIDLAMHLLSVDFKAATKVLINKEL